MRHAPATLHFSHAFRPLPTHGAIEWEELPSLAERVRAAGRNGERTATYASAPWDSTRPAALEVPTISPPFREALKGVAVREVIEPDVFRHFFGR